MKVVLHSLLECCPHIFILEVLIELLRYSYSKTRHLEGIIILVPVPSDLFPLIPDRYKKNYFLLNKLALFFYMYHIHICTFVLVFYSVCKV